MSQRPPDPAVYTGRNVDSLSLAELRALHGKWAALELYSPDVNPPRTVAAVGDSPADCARQLQARGLDIGNYEFRLLRTPA